MPRNVRNFWLDLTIDGKQESINVGPRAADGGFTLIVNQRDRGGIITAARITGRNVNGQLELDVTTPGQNGQQQVVTQR